MSAGSARLPRALFAASALLYLVCGLALSVGHGFLMGDALSRVSATQSALFSRDPHLSAIGFVFTPLTSLAQLPVVAFAPLFMAGAVVMVFGIGVDRGAPLWLSLCVTACFALNPMIVFYAANGMSEAPFLFCLCWALRRLMRWVRTDDANDLTAAGISLGLAYLTRYDALAPAAAAAALVGALSWWRRRGAEYRWSGAVMDVVLVVAPVVLAFVVWAATSWLITGQAFQQFSSQYGNSAIIAQSGAGRSSEKIAALRYSAAATLVLGPALPLLIPIVGALAVRRRDLTVVVPLLLCGAVLAFQALSYAGGSTFAFLRFYVAAIPLAAVLALGTVPVRRQPPSRRPGAHGVPAPSRHRVPVLAAAAALLLLLGSLPLTTAGMNNHDLAVQEYALGSILAPEPDNASQPYADEVRVVATFGTERRLANRIDAMALPRGAVLLDTVYGFAVLAASHRPDRFVVPSDRDFVRILNRPAARGVKYILAVPNSGRGASDAVNRRYPTIYENGAGIATLVLEIPNDGAGQPNWRLYRVIGS
ncbi:ABC transporter [Nocardia terpenica]|uniref:ABC transporter n=1 Tax=Nocardia terpenica TaxID=455432 RepID=UPI002FE36E5F